MERLRERLAHLGENDGPYSLDVPFLQRNIAYEELLQINLPNQRVKLPTPLYPRIFDKSLWKLTDITTELPLPTEAASERRHTEVCATDYPAQIEHAAADLHNYNVFLVAIKPVVRLAPRFLESLFMPIKSRCGSSHYYSQLSAPHEQEVDCIMLGFLRQSALIAISSPLKSVELLLEVIKLEFPLYFFEESYILDDLGLVRCKDEDFQQIRELDTFICAFQCNNFCEVVIALISFFEESVFNEIEQGLYNAIKTNQYSSLTANELALLVFRLNGVSATILRCFDGSCLILSTFNEFVYASDFGRFAESKQKQWVFNEPKAIVENRVIMKILLKEPTLHPSNGDIQFLIQNSHYCQ